jgi:hypothetical protein
VQIDWLHTDKPVLVLALGSLQKSERPIKQAAENDNVCG